MSANSAKNPGATRARHSTLPITAYLTLKISESGKTNAEIASALGYPRPNIISMMKTGSMHLPINRVVPMAREIEVDPVFLLEKVLVERDPELWDGLKTIIGDQLVSKAELKVIEVIRKALDGQDVDLAAAPEFVAGLKELIKPLKARSVETTKASLERIAREKAPKG